MIDTEAPDFVSVIMPTYNRARCLARSVRSVLAQTHSNLELIIVDDASTDGTEALVRSWNDPRIVYLRRERNGGASSARNLGLERARGAFIAFQDSDDEWLLDKLERQLPAIQAAPEYGAVWGPELIHGHDLNHVYGPRLACLQPGPDREIRSGILTDLLLQGNLITPQVLLMRADVAAAVGPFDTRLPCNNDWEYMLRLSLATQLLYMPDPVIVKHVQSDSIHRRGRSKALSFLVILRKHAGLFDGDRAARSRWLFRAGRELQKLGRMRAAKACMLRSIRAAPENARPWLGLAQVQFKGAFF